MNTATPNPVEIRFAKIDALAVQCTPADQSTLKEFIEKRLGKSPSMYTGEPAVLDLSRWTEEDLASHPLNLAELAQSFEQAGVHLIEVACSLQAIEEMAEAMNLKVSAPKQTKESQPAPEADAEVASSDEAQAEQTNTEKTPSEVQAHANPPEAQEELPLAEVESPQAIIEAATREAARTMVIDQPVRSGQKIYAKGADLIVMGQVSHGAEVIADGNVHVYGVLRGRALAGASGNTKARIISTCFEAELVAIAGYYLTFEGGFPEENRAQPTLIYLDEAQEPEQVRLRSINIR